MNSYGAVGAQAEWISPAHVPLAVTPGALASETVAFDWASAVRGRLLGPLCQHSGRPGSTVRFTVSNLPTAEQLSFWGFDYGSPRKLISQVYPQVVTSAGTEKTYTVTLRVPSRAPVGSTWEVDAWRSDDPYSLLDLYDYYQVCSFAASRDSIARGEGVRLHGRINGATGGRATVFMRTRPAGQPASLKAPGWTRVARVKVSDGEKLVTPVLHPQRTTWYVVRYAGEAFPAFTPVVTVRVR